MSKSLSSLSPPADRGGLIADAIAGLTFSVVNVPQAMANATLATVNPVLGLHTLMIATPVGALFTSSVFMNVSTTAALSVATGNALYYFSGPRKMSALITLVLLIGLFQLLAGLLRLGTFIRFVSHSVMTGFITGIAVLIVLGAIPDLTGYSSPYYTGLLKLADTVLHLGQADLATMVLGMATIGLIVGFERTRLNKFALILAIAVVTVLSVLLTTFGRVDSLELVGDIGYIQRSLPNVMLPELSLIPELLGPAVAIGIIGLVQGAGVSQSHPNPDGKYADVSQDFSGQGLANIATSFFQGLPGGGSLSGTAVSVNSGARSRWANILVSLFVLLLVLLFADAMKLVPMTALGGLLVVVGIQGIRTQEIASVWQTNPIARAAMVLTFLATIAMPLQFAISVGVAISLLLHVYQSSNRVKVVEFVPVEGGFPVEQPPPEVLPDRQVTVLHAYGSLFFAAASNFEEHLPSADEARQAVAIIMVRGQTEVDSTMIGVLQHYAEALHANGGKLMLAGVSPRLRDQLRRTGAAEDIGEENLFMAQDQLGAAFNEAVGAARDWLKQTEPEADEMELKEMKDV